MTSGDSVGRLADEALKCFGNLEPVRVPTERHLGVLRESDPSVTDHEASAESKWREPRDASAELAGNTARARGCLVL